MCVCVCVCVCVLPLPPFVLGESVSQAQRRKEHAVRVWFREWGRRCRPVPARSRGVGAAERRHWGGGPGGRRWLTRTEADLTLRHGEQSERVHQQKDVTALIAKPLGDGARRRPPVSVRGGGIGGGDDDDRPAAPILAENPLDELGNIPPARPRTRSPTRPRPSSRDHRHEEGLAHTGACEDPETLALPTGHETVEHPHAELELVRHETSAEQSGETPSMPGLVEPHEGDIVDRPPGP